MLNRLEEIMTRSPAHRRSLGRGSDWCRGKIRREDGLDPILLRRLRYGQRGCGGGEGGKDELLHLRWGCWTGKVPLGALAR